MNQFATRTSVGVWQTFVVMGLIYFAFMMGGAFGYRLPPPGWRPVCVRPFHSRTNRAPWPIFRAVSGGRSPSECGAFTSAASFRLVALPSLRPHR